MKIGKCQCGRVFEVRVSMLTPPAHKMGVQRLNLRGAIRRHIEKVLAECEGNQSLTAECLGIARSSLWRWMNGRHKL